MRLIFPSFIIIDKKKMYFSQAMTSTEATTPEEEVKKIPKCENGTISVKCIERRLESFLRTISRMDTLNVTDTVQIVRKRDNFNSSVSESGESTLIGRLQRFAQDHVVKVKLTKDLVAPRSSRMFFFGREYSERLFFSWAGYRKMDVLRGVFFFFFIDDTVMGNKIIHSIGLW